MFVLVIVCPAPLCVQAIIGKEEGGHDCCVHAITSCDCFMFTADRKGIIKVRGARRLRWQVVLGGGLVAGV